MTHTRNTRTHTRTRTPPISRTGLARGLTVLAAAVLLGTGVSTASAAPAVVDPAGCAATLAKATSWPGTVADRTGTRRVFSDAYYSHLLASPACTRIGG